MHGEEPRGWALRHKIMVRDYTLDASEAAEVQVRGNPGHFNKELNQDTDAGGISTQNKQQLAKVPYSF